MSKYKLNINSKSKLSEFNIDEIRGWIIDRLYQIEINIDKIIISYFNPEKSESFRKIILNSSIVSIGGKLKILRNIPSFDKKIIEKIQKLISIRNAFAHLPVYSYYNIIVEEKETVKEIVSVNKIHNMDIMNSSGEIKSKSADELIDEFFSLNKEIREYFNSLNHS